MGNGDVCSVSIFKCIVEEEVGYVVVGVVWFVDVCIWFGLDLVDCF